MGERSWRRAGGRQECNVVVLTYDAQSAAAGAAAASNYLASEGVHTIVGPVSSPEVAGFNTIAKRNSQVSFSSSYSQETISPDFPLAFADGLDPTVWGPAFIKAAKDRFGFKSVVILGPNDQAGTDQDAEKIAAELRETTRNHAILAKPDGAERPSSASTSS
ncbi:ABC transporter substrate-binding protein [Mesorhizobium sp. A556]